MKTREEYAKEYWHSYKGTSKEDDEAFRNAIFTAFIHGFDRANGNSIAQSVAIGHFKSERDIHIAESNQFVIDATAKIKELSDQLKEKAENGCCIVEHGWRMAAEHDLKDHKEYLRKAVNRCADLSDLASRILTKLKEVAVCSLYKDEIEWQQELDRIKNN